MIDRSVNSLHLRKTGKHNMAKTILGTVKVFCHVAVKKLLNKTKERAYK